MRTHRALLTLVASLGVANALAQQRPPLVPTRDAVIEYRVQGQPGSTARLARVYFSGGKIRADSAGLPGPVIADRDTDRAMMVMERQHLYFEVPIQSGLARDYLLNDRMRYTRGGSDRVAGVSCTTWNVEAGHGRTATACITGDGLVLRGDGRDPQFGEGSIEAISVTYAPQPAKLFEPPPGFQRLAISGLSGLTGGRPDQ